MPIIDIRRHSLTKKGASRGRGSHLSQGGIDLAREIGMQSGPFDRVLTSYISRTLETAIAMGFAVDCVVEALGDIPVDVVEEIGHHDRWAWEQPFVEFAQFVRRGGPTTRLGLQQVKIWTDVVETVSDVGRVLIVSHGRVIEAGLVAAVPEGNFASWGPPFGHGEGVRLSYTRGRFSVEQFLRVEMPRDETRPIARPDGT